MKRPAPPKTLKMWAIWINYSGREAGHFYPYCDPVPRLFQTRAEAKRHHLGPKHGRIVRVRLVVR